MRCWPALVLAATLLGSVLGQDSKLFAVLSGTKCAEQLRWCKLVIRVHLVRVQVGDEGDLGSEGGCFGEVSIYIGYIGVTSRRASR